MFKPNPDVYGRTSNYNSFLGMSFEEYLINHGRWVVYARQDLRQRCQCWSDVQGGPDDTENPFVLCPNCLQTGHPITLERMKILVNVDVRKNYSSRSGMSPTYVGDVDSTSALIYSRAGTYPQRRDIIFEVEWSVSGVDVSKFGTPTRLLRCWSLLIPDPVITGDDQIVDFWLTGSQNHNVDRTVLESFVRAAGPEIRPPGELEGMTPGEYRPYGVSEGNRYPFSEYSPPPMPWRPKIIDSF